MNIDLANAEVVADRPIFECGGYRERSVIDGGYVAFVREDDYP